MMLVAFIVSSALIAEPPPKVQPPPIVTPGAVVLANPVPADREAFQHHLRGGPGRSHGPADCVILAIDQDQSRVCFLTVQQAAAQNDALMAAYDAAAPGACVIGSTKLCGYRKP